MTVKQQRLAMCRNPKFPSTLIEVGFMTSVEEYEYMLDGGIEKAADGITQGILEYFRRQSASAN
jgi:N-acetylmuramoyl-L-alanine amidase